MTENGQNPRVLLVAFSARNAMAQVLDELFGALSRRLDCSVMVPTNYTGNISGRHLFRVPCGISKVGGLVASVNPVAHWTVVSTVLRAKPDVIHVFAGEGYLWAVSLAVSARLLGIPIVVTLHDPDPHPGNVFERLNSVVRRPVLALTWTIHLFSSRHLERARELAPQAQCMVIAHGSLAGQFLRHRAPGTPREELILFFGRIQQYKGIDVLLRAMMRLPASIRLAIAGPGTLEDEAQRMVLALGGRVELHNKYLDDAEVAALMQRACVVALPYTHVTQSSVPAIAAAFGCRLVSSALGNFVEEVPRLGGTTVPPADPDALAAALAEALRGPPMTPINSPTFDDLSVSFVQLYRASMRQIPLLNRPVEQRPFP